ncbi:MAG TPA: type II secretion system F family protein [Dehalococcoidales bacterium]|nr:type II secretion system F family protein [Dehalococcoidales bacterium]
MARTLEVPKQVKKATYRYVATTVHGRMVKGTVKASSEIEAERLIVGLGLNPSHVEVAPSMFSLEEAFPSLFKVKPKDVIVFSRQLATLLRSGISLLPALEILQGQVATSRAFARILGTVTNDIRSGSSFSQAISKHPRAFNEIYCRTITVGEETGSLESVLHQMADFLEKQSAMAQKIGKALTYPALVLGAGVVVIILLITVVMPQLLGMFISMNVELPLPTRILIGLTNVFTDYTLYLVVAAAVLVAVALWLVKQPTGRRILDRLRLTMPVLGPPALMSELGRFARTLSVMVKAGLKLQEIMEIAPQATDNRVFRNALSHVHERLILGEGLSEPMSRIKLFPPLLVQMVAVGEESNTLDFTMGVVADFYETAAEERTSAMVGMIGPVSTIGIALLVGFIALAVIMPMYTLTGAF